MSATDLQRNHRIFLKGWVASILVIYLLLAAISLVIILGEKNAASRNHALRMDPTAVEPGRTPPDPLSADGQFVPVHVGMYLDGIEIVSIKDSNWTATFYLWFRWQGDKALDPGKHFHLIDAKIEKRDLQDNYSGPDGINYQVFKVSAKMTKFFNTTRVPLDDHLLNIYVEDAVNDATTLRYVADTASNVSSRVKVPGYDITGFSQVVKPHTYRTTHGDPRMEGKKNLTYTEYVFGLSIKRSNVGIYLKLFLGLFAGTILALSSFFIRPSDTGPRFSLPAAAYFGAVANTYLVTGMLPSSGQFGLVEVVTGIGLITITLCVLGTLVSGYFFLRKEEKSFGYALDSASWKAIGACFLLINILLPVAAFS